MIEFASATDYLSFPGRMQGVGTGREGTLSTWIKIDSSVTASIAYILSGGLGFNFNIASSDGGSNYHAQVQTRNSASSLVHSLRGELNSISKDAWHHIFISWSSEEAEAVMYLDGTQQTLSTDATNDDEPAISDVLGWYVATLSTSPGSSGFQGKLYDLAWWDGIYETDVSKFYNENEFINPGLRERPIVHLTHGWVNGGQGEGFSINGTVTVDGSEYPRTQRSKTAKSFAGERWYECERCGFMFRESDTTVEGHTGRRVCTTGPNDLDPPPELDDTIVLFERF